jgi:4-methylaminobutanoate oxidase (formaldehyde-forming)
VAEEHRAFRERVGIVDLSSFGKIEVRGPGASALLERVCDNRVDREPGSVVYTQFLERRGGIVADLTVTRLAEDRFRVVTGAGYVDADLGWLRSNLRDEEGEVELREVGEELAVIGLWGPRARDVLQAVTQDDVSNGAFPFLSGRDLEVGGAPTFAQRITYVGELGWELYVEPRWAVQVWDRLRSAGETAGIAPGGYRVLESLRIEKGYRYFGTDLTMLDTPWEAGLGFCVALDKGDFNGREALLLARERGLERRIRTLVIGGEDPVTVYGGEAVHHDGRAAGRLRSAAYGFTVRRTIGYAYLPAELGPGSEVQVEVFGELVPAEVTQDALYDPGRERITA